MNLKQPGFAHGACETFAKNKERIEKFEEKQKTHIMFIKTN